LIADRINTKELCVEDVCINKAQLKELLEKSQIPISNSQTNSNNQISNDSEQNPLDFNGTSQNSNPEAEPVSEKQSSTTLEPMPESSASEPASESSQEP